MDRLDNTIGHILETKGGGIVTTGPETSLQGAARLLAEKRIGVVLVCTENHNIVGLLSERDIIRAVGEYGEQAAAMPVAEFMSRKLKTCSPQKHPFDVIRAMHDGQFRHMPVVENGALKGLVSAGDLLTYLLDEAELDQESLILARLTRHL